jgi:hypothetical protein
MLEDFTSDQLQNEITRRLKAKIEAGKPQRIENPNFKVLIEMCQSYLDQVTDLGFVDEDVKEYIFEGAMCAVFGDDVWSFINSRRS